jgi:helix-turn-helix protein
VVSSEVVSSEPTQPTEVSRGAGAPRRTEERVEAQRSHAGRDARVIPLRHSAAAGAAAGSGARGGSASPATSPAPTSTPSTSTPAPAPAPAKEPLWRDVVGDVLRRERLAQERTLKDVADAARISMPYLSELERGRKEASSEVLAAAARALGLGLTDLLARGHAEIIRLSGAGPLSGAGGRSGSRITGPTASISRSQMRLAA